MCVSYDPAHFTVCVAVPVGYYFVAYFDHITTFEALDHGTSIGQGSYILHTCKCMNVRCICEVHISPTLMKVSDTALQTQWCNQDTWQFLSRTVACGGFYTTPVCQLLTISFLHGHWMWNLLIRCLDWLLYHLLRYKDDLSVHRSFLQAAVGDAKRSEQPNGREDKRAWGVCAVQPKVTRINVSACSIEGKGRVKGGA